MNYQILSLTILSPTKIIRDIGSPINDKVEFYSNISIVPKDFPKDKFKYQDCVLLYLPTTITGNEYEQQLPIKATEYITANYGTVVPMAATLSDLKLDGITITGFNPNILVYNINLPFGTTILPIITYVKSDINADAKIINPNIIPCSVKIEVTGMDITQPTGTIIKTYLINFTILPQ